MKVLIVYAHPHPQSFNHAINDFGHWSFRVLYPLGL